jgi:hypothetical protein
MLEVENVEVYGLNRAVNAVRNSYTAGAINTAAGLTEKSISVAAKRGTDMSPKQSHDSFLAGILVTFDVKYPLYWAPEFQRYHFQSIIMSESTMHSLEKFISGDTDCFNKYVLPETVATVKSLFIEWQNVKNTDASRFNDDAKAIHRQNEYEAFMRLRSNLPCGFEMWMTVTTNYLQLKTMWIQRHNHRLREDWGGFCKMIEVLPYFAELTGIGREV